MTAALDNGLDPSSLTAFIYAHGVTLTTGRISIKVVIGLSCLLRPLIPMIKRPPCPE